MTYRHLTVLQQLLPPISYDANAPHIKASQTAEAKVLDDLEDVAWQILSAINPANTPELLPLFEADYGLPDSCDGSTPTTESARIGALLAKMASGSPLTLLLLQDLAAKLGYIGTTVTKRTPATCTSSCNTMLNGEKQRFILDVNTPSVRAQAFANCTSPCNAPLAILDEPLLECVFRRIEPAHALFRFHYGV